MVLISINPRKLNSNHIVKASDGSDWLVCLDNGLIKLFTIVKRKGKGK